MIKLLSNRTFILVLAFVGGLVFSQGAIYLEGLTLPALALVLMVSATQVSAREFFPLKNMVRPLLVGLLLNYVLLGSVILLLAFWLMPTWELWVGFVLVASAPPGIAVVPFTYILQGDLKLSLLGTFGVYLASLLLTPTLVFLFTGEGALSPLRLFNTMVFLILVPLFLSQVINRTGVAAYVDRWRGNIINWGFFLVIFTVVGLNQEVFLKDYHILLPVSFIVIASSFLLAFLVEVISKRFNIAEGERNSYILLSTIKTSAFAAAVGLNLYGEMASLPGAVVSAWYALYFIFLGFKGDRIKSKRAGK